ncbi:LysM peptidoglycan-binding domain-containing protein [Cystobacter fuscus]|uniref:LysM peptidoglycan-binding domain-containing protein n=1 Tax=Cystobacter fuscus TaxID=43 RepID=UPI001E40861C|nr:penicillin-insensitive murein endopeptidase [Cystobacter fuscus]
MRSPSWIVLLLCAGCTAHVASTVPAPPVTTASSEGPPPAEAPAPSVSPSPEAIPVTSTPVETLATAPSPATPSTEVEEEDDEESADASEGAEGEEETETSADSSMPSGPFYTAEYSDEALTEMWKKQPKELGSISVGFVHSGRMVNSVQFPQGDAWIVVSPELAWATQETIDYTIRAIREVRAAYPKAPALRVNQISSRDGGYLRPHKSHQSGRDLDLGFYYPTVDPIRAREREKYIDLELNWALIKSLIQHTDVQMILVDKRVQKVLREYALSKGEDPKWVASLFGDSALIKHARGHRDHFHVRFYNPRAQELGWRIAPLLALQPDQNMVMHRVRSGDTLGGIALRYGSGVQAIKKASRLRSILLRIGQVLAVPLRGPCTRCPVPPPVIVPPRKLPPGLAPEAPAVASTPAPSPAPVETAVAPVEPTPSANPTETAAASAESTPAPAEPTPTSEPAVLSAQEPPVAAEPTPALRPVETTEPAPTEMPAHAASPAEKSERGPLTAGSAAGTVQ